MKTIFWITFIFLAVGGILPGQVVFNPEDWDTVADVMTFSRGFTPDVFTRERSDAVSELPIERSVYWGKGGTRLEGIRVIAERNTIRALFRSPAVFSPGTSIYLHVFFDRSVEKASYTIEIPVPQREGYIFLWAHDSEDPLMIGYTLNARFNLEAVMDIEKMPEKLKNAVCSDLSVDITTGFYHHGTHEEFYLGTVFGEDIRAPAGN
jgi:hypothetical protein